MRAVTRKGIELMHRGTLALSRIETAGIRMDEAYLVEAIKQTDKNLKDVEQSLLGDEVWSRWRRKYASKTNLGSIQQLGSILFEDMGYTPIGVTKSGWKMDEEALETVDHPFVRRYLRLRKLEKVRNTYLEGFRRETVNGYLHPSFNLHLMLTYRSSSSMPNFQNIPIRNKEVGELIRRCFVPRKGNRLMEIDFGQIEVRVAACYNKDPVLMKYIMDPSTDMHWDTAKKLFLLDKHQTAAHHKKGTRDMSKNQFVFPQFYGDYYESCAAAIWKSLARRGPTMDDGTLVVDHLKARGVTGLGTLDGRRPAKGTFARLVKETEDWFWNEQYTVYTRWKKKLYEDYLKTGYVSLATGFVCAGVYRKNQVINFPVQGAAFHCLLWSIIELQDWIRRNKLKAVVCGQIHDCLLVDCPPNEVSAVLAAAKEIMTKRLPEAWPWIVVPLETEADVTPVDGSWHEKEVWVPQPGGEWGPKRKAA